MDKTLAADLDELIDEITTDAYGEGEQLWAFRQAFADEIPLPCAARVIGEPVRITGFDFDGNERRGLTADCHRPDGTKHKVAASDVVIAPGTTGARYVAAYRKWMGLAPFSAGSARKAVAEQVEIVEAVVLSVKQRTATCRIPGDEYVFTVRTAGRMDVVPGEIAVVRPSKPWNRTGNLVGTVESVRLEPRSLGLVPLQLEERGKWNPRTHYWGDDGEARPAWARRIIAKGPRPEFEMEQVLPGIDPEDFDSDPIIQANEVRASGKTATARAMLMDLCRQDLRCLDAHAHLGNLAFDKVPAAAIRFYEAGFRIGELSLGERFEGLLPWGCIDNRPFLRCMNGYGLCLWRLHRLDEALQIFERMLWLNPADNQGVRFLLDDLRDGTPWEKCAGEW